MINSYVQNANTNIVLFVPVLILANQFPQWDDQLNPDYALVLTLGKCLICLGMRNTAVAIRIVRVMMSSHLT